MRAFIIIEELKGVGVSGVRVYQSKVSVFVVGLGERWATDSVEQLRLMACRLWGVGFFLSVFLGIYLEVHGKFKWGDKCPSLDYYNYSCRTFCSLITTQGTPSSNFLRGL